MHVYLHILVHPYSPFHHVSLPLSHPTVKSRLPPLPPGPGAANRSIPLAGAEPPLAKPAFPDSTAQCANASSDSIENRYSMSRVVNPDRFECGDGVRTEERPPRRARRFPPSNRLRPERFDGANHFRSMAVRPWTRTRRPSSCVTASVVTRGMKWLRYDKPRSRMMDGVRKSYRPSCP